MHIGECSLEQILSYLFGVIVSLKYDLNTGQKFDFVNWFYWSLWWQQCCCFPNPQYWAGVNAGLEGIGPVPAQPATGAQTPIPPTVSGIGIHIRIINGIPLCSAVDTF